MDELISKYNNSDLSDSIKNKRILIINTKIKKNELERKLKESINSFIIEFNSSGIDYTLEHNLKHMLILLKGDILESDFCKKINREFTLSELEQLIYQEELKGENLDDVKLNIKIYKLLDNINESYKDLKSILENTINIVLDNNVDNFNKYLQDNILDDITYNLLKEFIDYNSKENLLL